MTDVMNPLISMTPVIDLRLVDDAYTEFLECIEADYIPWNTSGIWTLEARDLNEELIRKGVPPNLDCILKVAQHE